MSVTNISKNSTNDILQSLSLNGSGDMKKLRALALDTFRELGLPAQKNEEYKHTPITRILEKNFDFSITNPTSAFHAWEEFTIPELDAYVVVFVNGEYKANLSSLKEIKGVELMTLDNASEKHADVVTKHLGKYADIKNDALTAWNTAGWTSGLYLSVADNITIDKPIVIHYIMDAEKGQVVSLFRNLFIVGKSSEITVIQKFNSVGDSNHFSNVVTEGVVNENGGLNFYQIQADKGKQYQFNQTTIHQTTSSRANAYTFTLNGELIRNNLNLLLNGEGCESHMYGLYLLKGNTLADNHTVADHQKPNSFSNEIYKGVIDGNAKGVFNGKIYVRPQAQKTNAFQSNRNVLLSDGASINTKPQLEIWADDVKCSHGCTSGQLDEEALFYLRTRGISKEIAQGMVLTAFAGEVVDAIKIPALKTYCQQLIADRLHKTN